MFSSLDDFYDGELVFQIWTAVYSLDIVIFRQPVSLYQIYIYIISSVKMLLEDKDCSAQPG